MLVCGNKDVKDAGSAILEGIGRPTQGGRGLGVQMSSTAVTRLTESVIMGKFGCTQIQTSSSCSSEKNFFNFWGRGWAYLALRFNRPFDKSPKKDFFGVFLHPKKHVLGQKMGL